MKCIDRDGRITKVPKQLIDNENYFRTKKDFYEWFKRTYNMDTDIESVSQIIVEDHICVDLSDIEREFTHSLDDFSIDDILDLLN